MSDVLVIAAHPDDEVLGCGGSIAKHVASGDRVSIMFLADGETARVTGAEANIDLREASAQDAAKILGAKIYKFCRLPDNRMDSVGLLEIVQLIESAVSELDPEIVYTHSNSDLNIDHQLTHRATLTACRPLPSQRVRKIFSFETLSATEWSGKATGGRFEPNAYIGIRDHLSLKLEALKCYERELSSFPHPRSIEAVQAQAKLRGAECGLEAAEAFEIVRLVQD